MKKAVFTLILTLALAGSAMATYRPPAPSYDGSSDVKAYGSITATYGQGITQTTASECGVAFTHKESFTADVTGMGALNHVGSCGALGVVDGTISGSSTVTNVVAVYNVNSNGAAMAGANDMTGVAGVAVCSNGYAGASGSSAVAQNLSQGQTSFMSGPGFAGVGLQCYNGSVNITTNAHTGR